MVRTWCSLADWPRGSLTIIQYSTLPTSTPPLPVCHYNYSSTVLMLCCNNYYTIEKPFCVGGSPVHRLDLVWDLVTFLHEKLIRTLSLHQIKNNTNYLTYHIKTLSFVLFHFTVLINYKYDLRKSYKLR